jgi:hypothetical protein
MGSNGFIIRGSSLYPVGFQLVNESAGDRLAVYCLNGDGDLGQKGVKQCAGFSSTPRRGGKTAAGAPEPKA